MGDSLDELRKELAKFCQKMQTKIQSLREEKNPSKQREGIGNMLKEILGKSTSFYQASLDAGKPPQSVEEIKKLLRSEEEREAFRKEVRTAIKNLYDMIETITDVNLAQAEERFFRLVAEQKKLLE